MKKYLIFLSLLFVVSLQGRAQSSCKISHFYQSGTQTDITDVVYGMSYDMVLVVNYNPLEQATDKLRVVLQLPAGDNSSATAVINANPIVISSQNLNYNQNLLTVDITGFSKTLQSTFTINVYNAQIAAVASCTPIAYTATSSLQYYSGTNGTPVDFPNNQFSSTINGKHSVGTITTTLWNQFDYSASTDANKPLYIDLVVDASSNTYPTTNILLNLNSNITIQNVTAQNAIAQTVTIGSKLYYSVPKYGEFVRVYFNLPENSSPVTLTLTGEAMYSACPGTVFPFTPISVSFTGKPDNAILTYPSIYTSYNYLETSGTYYPCGAGISASLYLDNIYNSPVTVQQPIVLTADISGNLQAQNIIITGTAVPNKVFIRVCGNTAYETTPLTYNNDGSYTIPSNLIIDKIRMEFLHLEADISFLTVNCISISGNQCMGSNPAVVFNLLKNEQPYISETYGLSLVNPPNYMALNYAQNIFIPNQKITPLYLYLEVDNTLQPTDYLSYTLSDNMTFPDDYNLEMNLNGSFLPIETFNTQYFNANPIKYAISPDRKTLTITNITILGGYSNCSTLPYNLFIQVTTQVVARPTSISNTNVFALKNASGVDLIPNAQYTWSVASTQSVTPTVLFSCDGGITKKAGITIKKNDAVNVYYTLQNTNLYEYNQKPITFYCTLPTNGVQPTALLLVQTKTSGSILIPSIITPNLYTVSYASGSLDSYLTLTYGSSVASNTNILQVSIPSITLDGYDKLELVLAYPANLGLSTNNGVRFYTNIDGLIIPPQSSTLTIGPKSDCDVFDCADCVTSFSPIPGNTYFLSAWVKESYDATYVPPATYVNSGVQITFNNGQIANLPLYKGSGPIVEGWQRIEGTFQIPGTASNIQVVLTNLNASGGGTVYFDDVRIHPLNSNMKSFVYNPSTQKLVAELDENNFATIYEYDDEGILIRVKKETERGVMTISETRTNQSKVQTNKIQDQ
jgi:hypothetical protein